MYSPSDETVLNVGTLTVILRAIPDQLNTPRNPRIINPFNRINLLVE